MYNNSLGFGDCAVLCCGGTLLFLFAGFALATGTLGRLLGFGGNFMNRAGGTFNNPNTQSGGRIGGLPGFNNPYQGSGGRIGGNQGYGTPNESSSGSIGGRSSNEEAGRGGGGGASFS